MGEIARLVQKGYLPALPIANREPKRNFFQYLRGYLKIVLNILSIVYDYDVEFATKYFIQTSFLLRYFSVKAVVAISSTFIASFYYICSVIVIIFCLNLILHVYFDFLKICEFEFFYFQ